MGKVILTGDRPTGRLHLGHYVGSLRRRVELQNSGEFEKIFIMIADAQALTDNADNPEKIRQNIIEVALDYLSAGLDPEKVTIFIQSQVPELCELAFYYLNLVTVQRLQRNPTVKQEIVLRGFSDNEDDENQNKKGIPVGFFTYPISQASDITAFRATTVPVGVDQAPMSEQTREIVHKFNSVYGETLVTPEMLLPENAVCMRLPGTDGKAKKIKRTCQIHKGVSHTMRESAYNEQRHSEQKRKYVSFTCKSHCSSHNESASYSKKSASQHSCIETSLKNRLSRSLQIHRRESGEKSNDKASTDIAQQNDKQISHFILSNKSCRSSI